MDIGHTHIRRMRSVCRFRFMLVPLRWSRNLNCAIVWSPRHAAASSPDRTSTRTHLRRMRSACNHHSKIVQHHRIIITRPMWETTSPRNTHAGLGKTTNEDNILPSMHETSLSHCPIRRGYFSEMLFPTWHTHMRLASSPDRTNIIAPSPYRTHTHTARDQYSRP